MAGAKGPAKSKGAVHGGKRKPNMSAPGHNSLKDSTAGRKGRGRK